MPAMRGSAQLVFDAARIDPICAAPRNTAARKL